MKKFLLSVLMLSTALCSVKAEWLTVPTLTGEQVNKNNVIISWTPVTDPDCKYIYEVLVYKMHKAKADETLTLLDENFDYIESTGTMQDYEHGKGYVWDEIKNAPGWTVKSPTYMNGAIGYDCWMNYSGNDNDDIFAGAYILSPRLDLSHVDEHAVNVKCEMAQMKYSSTGAIALYTYSYDERYAPGYTIPSGQVSLQEDLVNTGWTDVDLTLYGDEWCSDSRLSITSTTNCYTPIWVDDLRVSVNMKAGDMIPVPAQQFTVTDGNSLTIDTSDNTDDDAYYAYQVRTVYMDPDDGAFRAFSQYTDLKVIGQAAAVRDVADHTAASRVEGIYHIDGTQARNIGKGISIVRMSDGSTKKIFKK